MNKIKKYIYGIIIAVISIIIAIPLFNPNFNCYIGEGIQYIARCFEIKSISGLDGIISNFANGFGYNLSIFEGNFANVFIVFLNLIIKNINASYKMVCLIGIFLSGVTMYIFMKKISENKNIALLASGIYMMLPYHLTNIYIRNALSEQIALAILPLAFLGAYYLINSEKKHYYYPIAISLMFFTNYSFGWITLFITIVYFAVNFNSLKVNGCIEKILLDLALVVAFTACLWLPYIETNVATKYKINNVSIEEKEEFGNEAISIRKLFVTGKNEKFVFEVGPLLIVMFAITPMALVKIKKEYKKDYIFYLVFCLIFIFMATKIFPWKYFSWLFIKLKYPWCLLGFATFFLTIICSINIGSIVEKFKLKDSLILLAVSMIYVICLHGYIQTDINLAKIEDIEIGRISGKQEEISAGINNAEYLPLKAYENKFYIATRTQNMYVLSGKAVIEKENKNNSTYSAKVQTLDEITKFELPFIYYPGYAVKADGMSLKSFETENGFLGFYLPAEESATIEVEYVGTDIQKISKAFSILSIILYGLYLWKSTKNLEK